MGDNRQPIQLEQGWQFMEVIPAPATEETTGLELAALHDSKCWSLASAIMKYAEYWDRQLSGLCSSIRKIDLADEVPRLL